MVTKRKSRYFIAWSDYRRKFNGKIYYIAGIANTERDAQKQAKTERESRRLVRVIKMVTRMGGIPKQTIWAVWTHPRRPTGIIFS